MNPEPQSIQFEENEDRLKVVLPAPVNWLLVLLYSSAIVVWIGMLVVVLSYLVRGSSSNVVLTVILLLWLFVWLGFGRFLWTRWQFYAANREILFIEQEQITVRRPVSIMGLTAVYDIRHVSPFYFSEKHNCVAFDYAYHHVYFGRGLSHEQSFMLLEDLNGRFYPEEAIE